MVSSTPATATGAKSSSSSSRSRCISGSTKMLLHTVIIALIASLVLSVDAIRCHECNSHLDEDCISLRLNTPRAPVDNQYLVDCVTDNATIPFCRKSVVKIDVTGEQRIVRSCGKIPEPNAAKSKLSCFNADNEGFDQLICACYEDGCNSAPASVSLNQAFGMALVGTGMLLSAWLRRSG